MTLDTAELDSPLGPIRIAVREGRLCALNFGDRWGIQAERLARRFGAEVRFRPRKDPARIVGALRAYFSGRLDALDRIEVDGGGTPFQARVWRKLREVSPGRTISYGRLARAVGLPKAARAVGGANNKNPIAIVVPCHRVIGANRQLVGYASGLRRKRWLLKHEGAIQD